MRRHTIRRQYCHDNDKREEVREYLLSMILTFSHACTLNGDVLCQEQCRKLSVHNHAPERSNAGELIVVETPHFKAHTPARSQGKSRSRLLQNERFRVVFRITPASAQKHHETAQTPTHVPSRAPAAKSLPRAGFTRVTNIPKPHIGQSQRRRNYHRAM